ncbi:MAG: PorV/PorQ family protein [Thermotogae bacterium]|nr:PorV/PorQ family protein [Thermotogota bacterium]
MTLLWFFVAQTGEEVYNPFAKVGIAGSKFLQVYTSPKIAAMGEAAVSFFADDPLLMINNPASAMFMNSKAVGFGFMPYWVSTYVTDIAYIHPMGRVKMGGYLHAITSLGFEHTVVTDDGYEVKGEFNYTAMSAAFVMGARLTDRFSVAIAPKAIYEGFGSFSRVFAFALDVGTVFETGWRGVNIGMAIQNFGTDPSLAGTYIRYTFSGEGVVEEEIPYKAYNLPLTFRAGISFDIVRSAYHALIGVVEINHPNDNSESYNLGFQYSYADMFFLRLGKKFRTFSAVVASSHDEVMAMGFGIKFANLGFDYSYTLNYRMPDVSRLGLIYQF